VQGGKKKSLDVEKMRKGFKTEEIVNKKTGVLAVRIF